MSVPGLSQKAVRLRAVRGLTSALHLSRAAKNGHTCLTYERYVGMYGSRQDWKGERAWALAGRRRVFVLLPVSRFPALPLSFSPALPLSCSPAPSLSLAIVPVRHSCRTRMRYGKETRYSCGCMDIKQAPARSLSGQGSGGGEFDLFRRWWRKYDARRMVAHFHPYILPIVPI